MEFWQITSLSASFLPVSLTRKTLNFVRFVNLSQEMKCFLHSLHYIFFSPPVSPFLGHFRQFFSISLSAHLASVGEDIGGCGLKETRSPPAPAPAPPLDQECLSSPPPPAPFSSFAACRSASPGCPAGWRSSSRPCSSPCSTWPRWPPAPAEHHISQLFHQIHLSINIIFTPKCIRVQYFEMFASVQNNFATHNLPQRLISNVNINKANFQMSWP